MEHRILSALAAIALSWAVATPAIAVPFAEVGNAGDLPATAQITVGDGALTSISGNISSNIDADMFQFSSSGGLFTATTVGQPGTLVDTQLFLFTSAGLGITGNDDSVGLRSDISAVLAPGDYFLAISGFDRDPARGGAEIFTDNFAGVQTPTGPGGPGPIDGYVGVGGSGTYNIALTGATFVPEPGSLALLGLGLAALRLARRRLSKA